MSPREALQALLDELEQKKWCGRLEIEFHGGQPIEVSRHEAQKFVVPSYSRPLVETR